MTDLTPAQIVCKDTYSVGHFSHVATDEMAQDEDLGDGLFTFLMRELGKEGECEDMEEAVQRMDNVVNDVTEVRQALIRTYLSRGRGETNVS